MILASGPGTKCTHYTNCIQRNDTISPMEAANHGLLARSRLTEVVHCVVKWWVGGGSVTKDAGGVGWVEHAGWEARGKQGVRAGAAGGAGWGGWNGVEG